MAEITLPYHDGNLYSFVSMEAKIDGNVYTLKSLNYDDSLDPGIARGNSTEDLGTTAGKYSASGSCEMLKSEWDRLVGNHGEAYGMKRFLITAQYAEENAPTKQDELEKCRIKKVDTGNAEGNGESMVKLDLYVWRIKRNGKYMHKKAA